MLYTEPKIYFIEDDDLELHMFSDHVAVCWRTNSVTSKQVSIDGNGFMVNTITSTHKRVGKPYIKFVWLRETSYGETYIDEDSPVDGGLNAADAREYGEALIRAADYLAGMAV